VGVERVSVERVGVERRDVGGRSRGGRRGGRELGEGGRSPPGRGVWGGKVEVAEWEVLGSHERHETENRGVAKVFIRRRFTSEKQNQVRTTTSTYHAV